MAYDSMPPRPDCEFNFVLPFGIDTAEGLPHNDNQGPDHPAREPHDDSNSNKLIGAIPHTDEQVNTLLADDEDNAQQPLNDGVFRIGFSDDEGVREAFDLSWSARQARQGPPKNKKSSRRSGVSDDDDETIPRIKRARRSIFGGPVERIKEKEHEDHDKSQDEDMSAFDTLKPDIRQRMSSLNLVLQDTQYTHASNSGFGLQFSEKDSLSPVSSRAPSEESIVIPPDDKPSYKLRQNIDRSKASTYIDTDRTGDYDPAQEVQLETLGLQKTKSAKPSKPARKNGKGKEKVPKVYTRKCIVELGFENIGTVLNITNGEDNWPSGYGDGNVHRRKKREGYCGRYRRETPGHDPQFGIRDPSGKVDDMTGYPAARGCEKCRVGNKTCSMIGGGPFPCEECLNEDHSCEPIMKPTMKGRCKQCVQDEQETCSFEEDHNQAVCDECMANDHACESLPPPGYKTPRISIDEIMYGPNRRHIQCTFCRSEKKRCSLKKTTDKPPCRYCKKHGIGCTFYDLPKILTGKNMETNKKKVAPGPTDGDAPEVSKPGSEFFSLEDLEDMERNEDEVISRDVTPEVEMEDDAGNTGPLIKVKTSFAHPIQFNVQIGKDNDCNFCEMPMFGFFGHFEREVHVIQWYSGLGYTELGGGHREDKGATNMCTDCTKTRLQIIVCPGHTLQRISDAVVDEDFTALGFELMDAEPGSDEMRYQLQRWCSMCAYAASWGCTSMQPSVEDEDELEVKGCGLKLCDKCAETLRVEYDGDLEEMANEMASRPKVSEEEAQSEAFERKPRADVGFLRQDDLLMRYMVTATEKDNNGIAVGVRQRSAISVT